MLVCAAATAVGRGRMVSNWLPQGATIGRENHAFRGDGMQEQGADECDWHSSECQLWLRTCVAQAETVQQRFNQ